MRVYTAISITIGESKIFTQVLDTMLLDFFFYLITLFSKHGKCQKNRINRILELFKIILVTLQIYRHLYILLICIYLSLLLISFFET